jgi:hypothetical protein
VLKATPSVAVLGAVVEGRPVVLKCWRVGSPARRVYWLLRSSRGWRQWRGGARLARLGITTPEYVALVRGRDRLGWVEVLVMERLRGRSVLEHMARPSLDVRAEHRAAEALAGQCACMARAGIFNRDHKPSNLVLLEPAGAAPRIGVLDTVAVPRMLARGRGRVLGPPLERLVLEAIGVGVGPRRALIARFVAAWVRAMAPGADERRLRREVWRAVSRAIEGHGDPTPKDNPLSPPAR